MDRRRDRVFDSQAPGSSGASKAKFRRAAGLLLAIGLVPGAPAAQTLTPVPGAPNQAVLSGSVGGFPSAYTPSPTAVLGDSVVHVQLDGTARTLTVLDLRIRLEPAFMSVGRLGVCLQNQVFRLANPASPPTSVIGLDGSFSMSAAVLYAFESASFATQCFGYTEGTATATWDLRGRYDSSAGAVSLLDVAVTIRESDNPDALADGGTLTLNVDDQFHVTEPPTVQRVGDAIRVTGGGITPGSVLKVFLATGDGPLDVTPTALTPTAVTDTSWQGTLPWPWPVSPPHDVDLGHGFMSFYLVRTDAGFSTSNLGTRVVDGNPSLGVPGLDNVDGVYVSPASWDPRVAVANVERPVVPGSTTCLGNGLYDAAIDRVNVFTSQGNCGPLAPDSGGATWLCVTIPPHCAVGPGAVQVVSGRTGLASKILSLPIGEDVDITGVQVTGSRVAVTGTGFNVTTVVNLFGTDVVTRQVVNVGGFGPGGQPRIPLAVIDSHRIEFDLPPALAAGPAFVEALNPPFIPYTSSNTRLPGGAFTIP